MNYPLAVSTWDELELKAIHEVCASGCFTMGPRVRGFEEEFARHFGSPYAVMVNSGSSANLLSVAAQFYCRHPRLSRGDEVIVPAVSWSTTYYPLYQHGLRLKFVDIDLDTLNLDASQLEAAISDRTRAIFSVNLLGNPSDFAALQRISEEYGLLLLEDNCESMGARFDGRYTGTFGVCGTFSTFYSHHICTMEGGLILTGEKEIYHALLALRAHGWTRELPHTNLVYDKTGDPFDDLYRFVLPGYNVRPLEISGALGSCQLAKLPEFIRGRLRNALYFQEVFANNEDVAIQRPLGESSWFAFSLVLRGKLKGRRRELVRRLAAAGVECRPIVAGNFVKNPVVRYFDWASHGDLRNAQIVDEEGFYLGNHHIDLRPQIDVVAQIIADYSKKVTMAAQCAG
jgi:CDP-6-deoxy-D-xylo-4-hexulose-3-dehydrase